MIGSVKMKEILSLPRISSIDVYLLIYNLEDLNEKDAFESGTGTILRDYNLRIKGSFLLDKPSEEGLKSDLKFLEETMSDWQFKRFSASFEKTIERGDKNKTVLEIMEKDRKELDESYRKIGILKIITYILDTHECLDGANHCAQTNYSDDSAICKFKHGEIVEVDNDGKFHFYRNDVRFWDLILTINTILGKQDLLDWVDTLPYPLASILWLYLAELEPHKREDHLIHFFEVLAQFFCIVLMSSFRLDNHFFKRSWIKNVRVNDFWRPSIGTWLFTLRALRKEARSTLKLSKGKEEYYELSRLSPNFIAVLIDEEFDRIIQDANDIRNSKAHSGIYNEASPEYLEELESNLETAKRLVGAIFQKVKLIKPLSMKMKGGKKVHRVEILNGTRVPFQKDNIQLSHLLDTQLFYILDEIRDDKKALALVPMMKRIDNAFYFPNRVEPEEIKWVSYHLSLIHI